LHNASCVGIASAKDASGQAHILAMVIAGDYEPKPDERKRGMEPTVPSGQPKTSHCHLKVLS